jgi:hypothetical protein
VSRGCAEASLSTPRAPNATLVRDLKRRERVSFG